MQLIRVYLRHVVCLPPAVNITCKPIAIPRGDLRAKLNETGLIGGVASEVECEISSTFASWFFLTDGDI